MKIVRHRLLSYVCFLWLLSYLSCLAAESSPTGPLDSEHRPARFGLVEGVEPATIVLAATEHKGVLAAAKDLQRDITKITGVTPNIVHNLSDCAGRCVVIGTVDCPEGRSLLASMGVAADDLDGKWESFKYRVLNGVGGKEEVLAIAGSNVRGTIYGVYDFEEKHLGVDPFWFWADHEPANRGELVFDDSIDFGPSKEPTWKYRGWTLNDHPQFMEWMESGLVQRTRYSRYMFAIHAEVLERLREAALRLKMNMFTWYFIDIGWHPDYERLRATVDRGLFVTQHQMESLGADTGFWDDYWDNHNPAGKPKEFSYRLHPEAFREFWAFYIKRWTEFSPQVAWEINLRGWADGPYQELSLPDGGTPQQRAEIITQALADQARLVRQLDPNPNVEMMTTLYAEVGRFYDQGWIKIPEGVTTGFSDAGMSGMSYCKTFWTEPRDPARRYGQYFHTQYFGGGPQIAKCTPIEQYIKVNMDAMYERGDCQHMLLAMNELRHQQIEIRAIAEMLWDYPGFKPRQYMLRYCQEEFGKTVAPKVLALYDEYYAKYPHKMTDDSFKQYPSYHKVMEPLFTVIGNLLNIESGNRDGFVLNYRYDKEIYEQGIRHLGEVLDHALALRPAIPENRKYFFDYEFIDSVRQARGIYKISVATNEAIACLKEDDAAGALAALLEARPLVEDLYSAYKNNCSGEKWRYWYRSGTNEDVFLMYNLYQKARLRLEVESFDFVTDIEPQRHPYRGNVVMNTPACAGDAVYGSQAERLNESVYNGSPFSILSIPLRNVFQIGGVQRTYKKWAEPVPDYGLAYRFRVRGAATVYVAKQEGQTLDWLAEDGFRNTGAAVELGQWGWPYRYRNRPPEQIHRFELFARDFPEGEVSLGPNADAGKGLPYIVFVQPRLLAFENFHGDAIGELPVGWKVEPNGGTVEVVANLEYEGEMRPTVFDLSTVDRYPPLGLKSLRLAAGPSATSGPVATLPLSRAADSAFTVNFRAKSGQVDAETGFSIQTEDGRPVLTVVFGKHGKIAYRPPGGKDVEIVPYEAGRWYNLSLQVMPGAGKMDLIVQDDRINVVERKGLDTADPSIGAPAAIRLCHNSDQPDSWVLSDALDAWSQ